MTLGLDEIREELRKLEDLIITISLADGFVEDLVHLHQSRLELIAALAACEGERQKKIGDLGLLRRTRTLIDHARKRALALDRAVAISGVLGQGPFVLAGNAAHPEKPTSPAGKSGGRAR